MISSIHPEKRKPRWQEAYIYISLFFLIAALCAGPVAARDVHVGLTELKPSLYTDEQGKATGFFVDLIEDMAEKEGWNVIWISGTISESWDRLTLGEIDLLPAVTVTPEREKIYDFTNESLR